MKKKPTKKTVKPTTKVAVKAVKPMPKKAVKPAIKSAPKKVVAKKVTAKTTTKKTTVKQQAQPITRAVLRFTQNDTPTPVKEGTVNILNLLLAGFLDLALATKQAHWNMRGAGFIGAHEMLDPFNASLLDYADQFAERIVQLGGTAYGTVQAIANNTKLDIYPLDLSSVQDHLRALAERYADVANAVRKVVDNEMADEGTVNIVTDASNTLDKYLWFIESHFE